MSTKLTEEELSVRAPVWAALSNLFLDTDISLLHSHIAKELAAARYSDAELLLILRFEAGPTFSSNAFSIAGEWVGWSAEEAREMVTAYLHSPAILRWFRRMVGNIVIEHVITNEWPSIRALRVLEREP